MNSEVVADVFVERIVENDAEYLFLNPGTDTAPVLEAIARREQQGLAVPRVVLCLHEAVALAAAHGYYMVSGKPQVVVVHVDVGTQNLGAMLHNVWRSEIGVVIFAGRTPIASYGSIPGMRDLPVHWQQDVPDQDGIVRPYVKSIVELHSPGLVAQQIDRTFQLAATTPPGATYITAGREALMAPATHPAIGASRSALPSAYGPNTEAIVHVAQLLAAAKRPVVLTTRVGRNTAAVAPLLALAERMGMPVVDRRERMNFPSSHSLYVRDPIDTRRAVEAADLLFVIDSDVPWVPSRVQPDIDAVVIHIGTDPIRAASPNWFYPSDLTIQSDPELALVALNPILDQLVPDRREPWFAPTAPQPRPLEGSEAIDSRDVFELLDSMLDACDVVVEEVTTNADPLRQYLRRSVEGTHFQSGGSGLGWSLGASIGAKLATPDRRVVAVVGDGAFMFNNPAAALWTAVQESVPFLVLVLDNGGYAASRKPIVDLYPNGAYVNRETPEGTAFAAPADYGAIASAVGFASVGVEHRTKLESALRSAIETVDGGRGVVVVVKVTSAWFPPQ